MTLLRRAFTVPLVTVLMVFVLLSGPLLLAGAGITGLLTRSSRPVRTVALVMTLLSLGCPPQAIVAAFGFDERTVAREDVHFKLPVEVRAKR